jgi:hypothetical protein
VRARDGLRCRLGQPGQLPVPPAPAATVGEEAELGLDGVEYVSCSASQRAEADGDGKGFFQLGQALHCPDKPGAGRPDSRHHRSQIDARPVKVAKCAADPDSLSRHRASGGRRPKICGGPPAITAD